MRASSLLTRLLLYCGIFSSIVYIGADIIAVMYWEGYSYANYTISELIGIDSPTRWFVMPLFLFYSCLIFAFAWGIMRSNSPYNRNLSIGAGCIAIKEVEGVIGTLFTPIHMRGIPGSMTDVMHGILTMVGVVFMMFGIWFVGKALSKQFKTYSIVTMILLIVGGILAGMQAPNLAKNLPTPGLGIMERLNIYAYMLWIIILAILLMRKNKLTTTL